MDDYRPGHRMLRILIVTLVPLFLSGSLFAQAWVPEKGEGFVALGYQRIAFDGHFTDAGVRRDRRQSRSNSGVFDIQYGIADRTALSLSIPYIGSKYTGLQEPFAATFVDDKTYHGTFQDFRFELRHNIEDKPLALTPFVALIVPSHKYQTVGEAAPGRHLVEFHTGVNAGRFLDQILPRAYVHGRYTYAFVEKDLGVPLNRSNVDLDLGYFVTSTLSVRALANWQWTHGGILFPYEADTPELFLHHDRLLRANFFHVGGGCSFSPSRTVDIDGAIVTFVSGSNTHYGTGLILGVTWYFKQGTSVPRINAANPVVDRRSAWREIP
jgi:hypothetical protein